VWPDSVVCINLQYVKDLCCMRNVEKFWCLTGKNLNILNALAPGLLIGTALGIIIPEYVITY